MPLLSVTLACSLAAACTIAACGQAGAREPATRAVVIGIDGADWKVIDELAAAGGMPNLMRLRARRVSGPIETASDIALSPVIWTSVATGKTAAKHGITCIPEPFSKPLRKGTRDDDITLPPSLVYGSKTQENRARGAGASGPQ